MAAIRFGRLDVAMVLLDSGANADATTQKGEAKAGRNALMAVTAGSAAGAARP